MNSAIVNNFLKCVEQDSEIEILEAGKEREDLLESAKKRGILLAGDSKDLGVFKTIYSFTDMANSNGAILPEAEFTKVLPQIVGRPVNIGHQRKMIVGFYTDYKYITKKKQAIAYGIFFKSVYPELWEKAVNFQKKGKLSSSFEIWSPRKARKILTNGTYELHNMQMAGGALIFEENGEEPAFKDAKVLEMAKDLSNSVSEDCLIYASKYQDSDIIFAEDIKQETINCQNCQKSFIPASLDVLQLNCPHCFSVVDRTGKIIYPPQIKDYKLQCPNCNGSFIVLKNEENKQELKCNGCGKEYEVEFYDTNKPEALSMVDFVYETKTTCPQCSNVQPIDTLYNAPTQEVRCRQCNLIYPFDVSFKKIRKVKNMKMKEEIKEEKIEEKKEADIVESKKFKDGIKKMAEKVIAIKKQKTEELETANNKINKLEKKYKKLLLIAKELKGQLSEVKDNKTLAVQELDFANSVIETATYETYKKDKELEEAVKQTEMYKANAQKILERKESLGIFAKDMTDEQILDDKDYEIAALKKVQSETIVPKVAKETVGDNLSTASKDDHYRKIREQINKVAFGK